MAVDGWSVAAIGAGGLLVYAGLHGKSVLGEVRTIIAGHPISAAPGANPLAGGGLDVTGLGAVTGSSPTGNAIATDALQYQGHLYHYGGAPGTDGTGPWDCSSYADWVIGHDLGAAIPGYPGGQYTGAVHGPTTLSWLASIGTVVTVIPRSELQAGDIPCWQTHMGIAISNSQMISAQGPNGTPSTVVGPVAGPGGEALFCLRLLAIDIPKQKAAK